MEEMPKHPHLTRRGNVFWLRQKVPTDLRDHDAPKTRLTFSLRTSDAKEAKRQVCLEAAKLEGMPKPDISRISPA